VNKQQTTAKDVLPSTARKPPKSPPAATQWCRSLLRDVICSERVPFSRCRGVVGLHSAFILVTLTLDL